MISGIFLLSHKGDILISRTYRDDISRIAADQFRTLVISAKEVRSPIKQAGNTIFLHILEGNIFVVAVTAQNVNVSTTFEVLHKLVQIFRSYFEGKFDEESIRSNFVLIYELLDEIIDFGYPQTTTFDALKLYITQAKGGLPKTKEQISRMTNRLTGQIPWREPSIRYKQNEIFIDIIESVNLLVSAKGNILRADVSGQVKLKCMLSGMPECKFGLNDKLLLEKEAAVSTARVRRPRRSGIEIDDVTFHQCVRLGKFDSDRTISFIPPDGEFELMKYRITDNINLPFRVLPIVKEVGKTKVEYIVTIKTNFTAHMIGTTVNIKIPTPPNTAICKIKTTNGKAKFQPALQAIIWRVRRFPGDLETTLTADVQLTPSVSGKQAWSRPPISMQFTVPMFTASGLHVRFLKVVETKLQYQTIKWVRYITKAGQYQHRI